MKCIVCGVHTKSSVCAECMNEYLEAKRCEEYLDKVSNMKPEDIVDSNNDIIQAAVTYNKYLVQRAEWNGKGNKYLLTDRMYKLVCGICDRAIQVPTYVAWGIHDNTIARRHKSRCKMCGLATEIPGANMCISCKKLRERAYNILGAADRTRTQQQWINEYIEIIATRYNRGINTKLYGVPVKLRHLVYRTAEMLRQLKDV